MTLWCPDTCGCEITIEDDKSSPDYALSVAHQKICKDHARLGHGHRDVMQENQRKNRALDDVIKTAGLDPKTDTMPTWVFDSDRVLTLTLPSGNKLNAQATAALQANLDVKYGAGKVRVA